MPPNAVDTRYIGLGLELGLGGVPRFCPQSLSKTCVFLPEITMNHYNTLRKAIVKTYPQRSAEFHNEETGRVYNRLKTREDQLSMDDVLEIELKRLREEATKRKAESIMYFVRAAASKPKTSAVSLRDETTAVESAAAAECKSKPVDEGKQLKVLPKTRTYVAHAQQEAELALQAASEKVAELSSARTADDDELKKAICAREAAKKVLAAKQGNAKRQLKFQRKRRQQMQEMCEGDETCRKKLCINAAAGRPSENTLQPGLLEAIIELSLRGAGAHERRRAETLNSCRTLDDLTRELKTMGFNLSRSGTYLRLMPRNWTTTEGQKHITTVNVKLRRAENSEHRQHDDTSFARATHEALLQLCSILGPQDVACISQDDKAKVPLGLPAANKQTSVVMNMEYQVKLPDHDFVIAAGHKLVPSVVAGLTIAAGKLDNAVGYSGPTYIGIRSGKHDSSVAATHAADLRHIYEDVPEFRSILWQSSGLNKPVLVVFVDGGPDENPRYRETIKFACEHFKRLQLDALFVSTQAPGRSAYNPVERRMAPLSRFLAGIILPYDTFGSHLNTQGQTVDEELERENFQQAGQALAGVWCEAVIDGFPVVAEWRGGVVSPDAEYPSQEWLATHVRASQYFLQVVKCDNDECCAPLRSNLKKVLPCGFLPPPLSVSNSAGLTVESAGGDRSVFLPLFQRLTVSMDTPGYTGIDKFKIPYDVCCPTVTGFIANRTCGICKLYFPSAAMVTQHKKEMHPKVRINVVPRTRPVRIAARRQRQLMAIIASGMT